MSNKIAGYRPDVDGLRAVAVISVVAFHVSSRLLPGGFIGVDVFFVISGFLISGLLFKEMDRGTFTFRDFYWRRLRRITPALIVMLVAVLAIGWFELLATEYESLGKHVVAGATFVSNLLLYREINYFDAAAELKPLLHLWSLGIEEQFYVMWPIVLIVAWKRRWPLVPVIGGIAGASLLCDLWLVHAGNVTGAFYLPQARLWELLVGAYVAARNRTLARTEGERRPTSPRVANALAGIGLIGIVAAFATFGRGLVYPGAWPIVPTFGAAAIIAAGPASWVNKHLLANRFMVAIGLMAYSLYLWHWPLIVFVRLQGGSATQRAMAAALSVVLAWLTTRLVENPIRFGPLARGRWATLFPPASLAALLGVGAAGLTVDLRQGFATRFPAEIRFLVSYHRESGEAYGNQHCFLLADEGVSAFAPGCLHRTDDPNAPSVLLWGDSFAAHLLPGLKAVRDSTLSISQYSASACPPVLGVDLANRRECRSINEFVLQQVTTLRPRTVIIAANWTLYDPQVLAAVKNTIRDLQQLGIRHIALVGPAPLWYMDLPAALARASLHHLPPVVPDRLPGGAAPAIGVVDDYMRSVAAEMKVAYLSPMAVLCNPEGCLTRLGTGPDDIMSWDIGHFSVRGSEYVVSRFDAGGLLLDK